MRTTYLIKKHEKAIRILDVIAEAKKRLNRAEGYIQDWHSGMWHDGRKDAEKTVASMKAVIDRLTAYYLRVLDNITSKAEI